MAAKANSPATQSKAGTKGAGLGAVMQQVQPMIEHLGGFIVGNLAINMLNKALKVDPTNTADKGIKRILPPLGVTAGAMFGSMKAKQPLVQHVLQGVAIAGAYKTAKALMPAATFLAGDNGLGLTPVSAVSNTDRWLYHERTPVSGIGFPDLGTVQPPERSAGYYIDAPAYMQGTAEQPWIETGQMRGAPEEQFYGANYDDSVSLSATEGEQIYGGDIEIL